MYFINDPNNIFNMRKKEFMKKSEARIIIYLANVGNVSKSGGRMSETLKMDYIYAMRILSEMYQKEWLKVHEYNQTTYFELTDGAPREEAIKIKTDNQTKIYSKLK